MHKIKHNKVRNTGLLFEFLLRQITSDVLNKKDSEAVKIIKQKFCKNLKEQSILNEDIILDEE